MAIKCDEIRRTESIDEYLRLFRPRKYKPRQKMKRPFIMLFQDTLKQIMHCKLSGGTWAVLMYIMMECDYDNYVEVNQKDIADHVGLARGNVSRAIKSLVDFGIIEKTDRKGSVRTYRINWQYVWKGGADAYHEAERTTIARKLSLVKG